MSIRGAPLAGAEVQPPTALDPTALAMSGAQEPRAALSARYRVRRVTWTSALKVGLLLGWSLALVPAMLLAWLATRALAGVATALGRIQNYDISILGQTVASIDPIALAGQTDNVNTVVSVSQSGGAVFLLLTVLLTILGGLLIVAGVLLFVAGYNLLARAVGGFELELEPRA